MAFEYRPPYLVSVKESERLVELWSAERLPFEPKGWLKAMRDDLRDALESLKCDADEVLHAVYLTEIPARFDAENVLLYNVGATYFNRSCARGLRFESVLMSPPAAPSALEREPKHYHLYRPANWSCGFRYWTSGKRLAAWNMQCSPLTGEIKAAQVWRLVKSNAGRVETHHAGLPPSFALRVAIDAPESVRLNAAALVKPLFDGVLSAFHVHDGSSVEDLSRYLAESLNIDDETAAGYLMDDRGAVLGNGACSIGGADQCSGTQLTTSALRVSC